MLNNTEKTETETQNTSVNVPVQAMTDLAKLLQKFEKKLVDRFDERIEQLEKKVKLARGTRRNIQPPPAETKTETPVVQPAPAKDLSGQVEDHLRENFATLDDLAKHFDEPANKIAPILKDFNQAKKIHNIGREDHPRWTWRVGESISNADLIRLVKRLASDQPMYTWEMAEALGVRPVRINNAMVEIQRSSSKVINLGNGKTYRWFVIPEHAKRVNLKSKAVEK